jgi:Spy/CpxP family protein refolding chaperone
MKAWMTMALLAASAAHAQHGHHATPYAGLQAREIKALSPEDAQKLLQGQGMSLALAAELNGYPGPLHVLELAQPLELSASQREQTQALMDAHKAEARELGRQLVEAERALDAAFAAGAATEADVARLTRRIGELQGLLRAAHLQTHLKQKALLTPRQVAQYQHLRGYATAKAAGTDHQHGGKHQ